jgi:uncharacterized delta-60 repeat protein
MAANISPFFSVGDPRGYVKTNFGTVTLSNLSSKTPSTQTDYRIVNSLDTSYAIALQSDGKILIVGATDESSPRNKNFAVARYNQNGSLDSSFGGDGTISTDFKLATFVDDSARAVSTNNDGKILVVGDNYGSSWLTGGVLSHFELSRYNPNGSIDPNFGGDGKVDTDFGAGVRCTNITFQTDGKIVLVGFTTSGTATVAENIVLARYNSDGTLDSSFSGDGKVITRIETDASGSTVGSSSGLYVSSLPDGKILLSGTATNSAGNSDVLLVRYNPDGSLDTSFDGDGKLKTDVGVGTTDICNSTLVQPDGKILVAGTSAITGGNPKFTLLRYNSDGALDSSFDADGKLISTIESNPISNNISPKVQLQSDGKIIALAGGQLMRLNIDGSLDATFDGDGFAQVNTGSGTYSYSCSDFVIQADGKILVSSNYTTLYSVNATYVEADFVLIRYNSDGSLDTSFYQNNSNGTLDSSPIYKLGGLAVVLDSSVSVYDPELSPLGNYGGASVTLSRHGGARLEDVFSLNKDISNIASVTSGGGILNIQFNSNATQNEVNSALSAIVYGNSSSTPDPYVQIDWVFNDGNTGSQGDGGVGQAVGSITVRFSDDKAGISGIQSATLGGMQINGVDGTEDTVSYAQTAKPLKIDLQKGVVTGSGGKDTLYSIEDAEGSEFKDTITGDDNSNTLDGKGGNDIIKGNGGNDDLTGGADKDTLVGGDGDDTYHLSVEVDGKGKAIIDKITEGARITSGIDTVNSEVSYILTANVERLSLNTGAGAIDGTGNKSANSITGNESDNTLNGKEANDTLTGDAGADIFKFDTKLSTKKIDGVLTATNVDTLVDFTAGTDDIYLSGKIFSAYKKDLADAVKAGGTELAVSSDDLVINGTATAANHHFIYDSTSGALYYDPDGNGAKAQVQFAIIGDGTTNPHPTTLSTSDIHIV